MEYTEKDRLSDNFQTIELPKLTNIISRLPTPKFDTLLLRNLKGSVTVPAKPIFPRIIDGDTLRVSPDAFDALRLYLSEYHAMLAEENDKATFDKFNDIEVPISEIPDNFLYTYCLNIIQTDRDFRLIARPQLYDLIVNESEELMGRFQRKEGKIYISVVDSFKSDLLTLLHEIAHSYTSVEDDTHGFAFIHNFLSLLIWCEKLGLDEGLCSDYKERNIYFNEYCKFFLIDKDKPFIIYGKDTIQLPNRCAKCLVQI